MVKQAGRRDGGGEFSLDHGPEGLAFDDSDYLDDEGELIDKPVEPREWKFNLDEQIKHYLVQDLGDDSSQVGPGPQVLDSSPPLHHYVSGTRYLRNFDKMFRDLGYNGPYFGFRAASSQP